MKFAPLVLGTVIRARSGIPDIVKFSCWRTGRFARIYGRSLCHTASRVAGNILVLGTFLFHVLGQSNQNLVVVGALLVPLSGRLVDRVKVYHIVNEGAGVEILGLLHPLTALALDVCKEIPGCIAQLVKG